MGKKKTLLTKEQKRAICQQYQEGRKYIDLAREFNVTPSAIKYVVRNFVEDGLEQPLLHGYKSVKDILMDYCRCSIAGFDSPESVALCKSKGVTVSGLQAFAADLVNPDKNDGDSLLTSKNTIREICADYRSKLAKKSTELERHIHEKKMLQLEQEALKQALTSFK